MGMNKNIKKLMFAVVAGSSGALSCAEAAIVQLPEAVIYSGGPPPRLLQAKVGDSNIKIIPGLDFRITNRPKANGISKDYLESQIRKTVTSYNPQTGLLTASTPKLAIGSVSAEVTVEIPNRANLAIRSLDGNISLERISVESLAIETTDGNVDLTGIENSGKIQILTVDGNVSIRESSVGEISTEISGDGRFLDARTKKTSGPGILIVTTKDGNISVQE